MSDTLIELKVGLVMPIALIDNCGPDHWLEIRSIIVESLSNIKGYSFDTRIVSESDSIGLIHKRIVQGLYNSDIVVCDVSCKNPNVMFELGMRLAFDKPTIIIKDDKTDFSFDTSGIEHIQYPRDLRFSKIVDFKSTLATKVIATYEDAQSDLGHSPFLKSFGDFKAVKIESTDITSTNLILETLTELQGDINSVKRELKTQKNTFKNGSSGVVTPNIANKSLLTIAVNEFLKDNHSQEFSLSDAVDYIQEYILTNYNKDINANQFKGYIINMINEQLAIPSLRD